MENSLRVPQKLNIELPYEPSTLLQGVQPKNQKHRLRQTLRHPHSPQHQPTAKWRTQPKCLSTDEWINKMQYIHTIEYYSAFKKKEILTHVTTWMNFVNTVLNELNQSPKGEYCRILVV